MTLCRILELSWRKWYAEYFDAKEKVGEGIKNLVFSHNHVSIQYDPIATIMLVLSLDR